MRAADGTGGAERLLDRVSELPQFWTPDGTGIVESRFGAVESVLLMIWLAGTATRRFFSGRSIWNKQRRSSPDCRFMTYETTEVGRSELYVQSFPEVDSARWIVSSSGGTPTH